MPSFGQNRGLSGHMRCRFWCFSRYFCLKNRHRAGWLTVGTGCQLWCQNNRVMLNGFVGRKAGPFYSVCKVVNRLFWQAFSTNSLYLSTLLLTPLLGRSLCKRCLLRIPKNFFRFCLLLKNDTDFLGIQPKNTST